jgi:hypothetical protein
VTGVQTCALPIFDEALLEETERHEWWKFAVADDTVQSNLEAVKAQYDEAVKAIVDKFEDRVDKLQRGDELPPGVLKMVKVFVAVKRKLQPGDKMAGRHGNKGVLFCHTPLVAVARNVGRKRALEMALTGDAISAATAAEWGLINHAVPDADLEAATADLLRRATRGSAASKAVGKRTFYEQVGLDQAAAYDHAVDVMARSAVTADAQEGIAAFLEKRAPRFGARS